MKLLLTSAGIKNKRLHDTLVEMLGKPIAEARAICITTAIYALPGGAEKAWDFLSGQATTPMCELGWKSMGVLELSVLQSIDKDLWLPSVQEADCILVNGGDPLFLAYWMRQSGFADILADYKGVYVGLSAGSMVMTPRIGQAFVGWKPPEGGDNTLGLVDFSIFPHLDHEMLPENTMADAISWSKEIDGPAYAIDDQTAIKVVDDSVEVISEGVWKLF